MSGVGYRSSWENQLVLVLITYRMRITASTLISSCKGSWGSQKMTYLLNRKREACSTPAGKPKDKSHIAAELYREPGETCGALRCLWVFLFVWLLCSALCPPSSKGSQTHRASNYTLTVLRNTLKTLGTLCLQPPPLAPKLRSQSSEEEPNQARFLKS